MKERNQYTTKIRPSNPTQEFCLHLRCGDCTIKLAVATYFLIYKQRRFAVLNENTPIHIFIHFDFLNRPLPASFLFYSCLFKQTLQFFQQIYVKKCPSSKQCWDLNLQPLGHESPPITSRPGLTLILPQEISAEFLSKIFV